MNKRVRTLVVWRTNKDLGFDIPEDIKVTWSDPRYWNGVPRPIHDAVYAPENPEIERVHEEHGKVIWRPEGFVEKSEKKIHLQNDEHFMVDDVPDVDNSDKTEDVATEEVNQEEVEAPVDEYNWRDLSWPKLRSLATEFTDEPVKSKAQATEVLSQAEADGKLSY